MRKDKIKWLFNYFLRFRCVYEIHKRNINNNKSVDFSSENFEEERWDKNNKLFEKRRTIDIGHLSYALLYVAIEGFKELKMKNDLEKLHLNHHKHLQNLRKFRNSVFHVKRNAKAGSRDTFACLDEKGFLDFVEYSYKTLDRFFYKELIHEMVEKSLQKK